MGQLGRLHSLAAVEVLPIVAVEEEHHTVQEEVQAEAPRNRTGQEEVEVNDRHTHVAAGALPTAAEGVDRRIVPEAVLRTRIGPEEDVAVVRIDSLFAVVGTLLELVSRLE